MKQLPPFDLVSKLIAYDPDTGFLTRLTSRGNASKVGDRCGTVCKKGYRWVKIGKEKYSAHRIAWLLATGAPPKDQIDHRNGKKDDNRFENLREAVDYQQAQNRRKRSDNTSGHTGVHWEKESGRWKTQIMIFGRHALTKRFDNLEDAVSAYETAKAEYHRFQPEQRK